MSNTAFGQAGTASDLGAVAAAAGLPGGPAPGPAARRSTAGYWLAGTIAVLAVIAAAALGIARFVDTLNQPDDYVRSAVPGAVTLRVGEPGDRIVYAEGVRLPASAMRLAVTGPDGDAVPVTPYTADLTYSVGGHSGNAVARFDADATGDYRVVSRAQDAPDGAGMAVGGDLFDDLIGIFVGPLIVFGAGMFLAAVLLVSTLWTRRRPGPERSGLT